MKDNESKNYHIRLIDTKISKTGNFANSNSQHVTSKEAEQTEANHNHQKPSTDQLLKLNKKFSNLNQLQQAMSRIPALDTIAQLGEDVSFVGWKARVTTCRHYTTSNG